MFTKKSPQCHKVLHEKFQLMERGLLRWSNLGKKSEGIPLLSPSTGGASSEHFGMKLDFDHIVNMFELVSSDDHQISVAVEVVGFQV